MATRRSTTPWCAWRRTSPCACRWSTARAISAPWTAIRRRPCAIPRRVWRAPATALLDDIDKDTVDFQANYDDTSSGADGPAGALSQSAGQWRRRHRRRHGDQHPDPQSGRGGRRLHRLYRRSRYHHRRADGASSPARISRPAASSWAGPASREAYPHRARQHRHARPRARSRRSARTARRSSSPRSPIR